MPPIAQSAAAGGKGAPLVAHSVTTPLAHASSEVVAPHSGVVSAAASTASGSVGAAALKANASFVDAVAAGELFGSNLSLRSIGTDGSGTEPPSLPPLGSVASRSAELARPLLSAEMGELGGAPGSEAVKKCKWWREAQGTLGRVCKVANTVRKQVLVPPVMAVLSGLLCSTLDPTYYLLCGGEYGERLPSTECPKNNAYLSWLFSGLTALGKAAVPINLILTGNALSKGPDWKSLPLKANLGILLGKMLLMPTAAMLLMVLVDNTLGHKGNKALGLEHPWDEAFYIAALAVAATPSANNLMVMVELSGGLAHLAPTRADPATRPLILDPPSCPVHSRCTPPSGLAYSLLLDWSVAAAQATEPR